ncbi:unnamed protein product [Amoebophrya sp. A25]|nr:unnamed protein product [Amoebophrya sp. A25]|eukprot:GSA25T00003893001.1
MRAFRDELVEKVEILRTDLVLVGRSCRIQLQDIRSTVQSVSSSCNTLRRLTAVVMIFNLHIHCHIAGQCPPLCMKSPPI